MESTNEANGITVTFADPSVTTTHALVAYLRSEADLADEKAKRLRAQAAALAEQFGVTEEIQAQYELRPDQLPPVDQNGVPRCVWGFCVGLLLLQTAIIWARGYSKTNVSQIPST